MVPPTSNRGAGLPARPRLPRHEPRAALRQATSPLLRCQGSAWPARETGLSFSSERSGLDHLEASQAPAGQRERGRLQPLPPTARPCAVPALNARGACCERGACCGRGACCERGACYT